MYRSARQFEIAQSFDVCLRLPIISVSLAAKELGVSQQAATTMIDELSFKLRELTERRRYQARILSVIKAIESSHAFSPAFG